jgi:hypothetical protein
MKLKIKIMGPRVRDVGYHVFLLKHAMNLALPGLSTYNWEEDGRQELIALVEKDDTIITAFRQMAEKNKLMLDEVFKATFEDYDGDVRRTSEVAMLCSSVQLDKAIPLLLYMRDDLKAVRKTTDLTLAETKSVRKNTEAIPQVLDEIKGLREDIPQGYATNFRRVQANVRR